MAVKDGMRVRVEAGSEADVGNGGVGGDCDGALVGLAREGDVGRGGAARCVWQLGAESAEAVVWWCRPGVRRVFEGGKELVGVAYGVR